MVVFAVSLAGWFVLDLLAGGADGDNARVSMAFLRHHPRNAVTAGLMLWIAALSLILVVTVVSDVMEPRSVSTLRRAAATVGYFSAAFLLLYGVLVVATPGTLVYMGDLDRSWGEGAYLAVQIIGTQGSGIGGLFAFSI